MVRVIFASSQHPSLAVLAAACMNEMAFAGLARASAATSSGTAVQEGAKAQSDALPLDPGVREFLRDEHIRADDTRVSGLDRETLREADLVIAIGEIAGVDLRADELWMLPTVENAGDPREFSRGLRDRVWQLVADRGWWMRKQAVVSHALEEQPGTLDTSETTAHAEQSAAHGSH